jgi:putative ABC transport system ATP-binding protein
MSLILRNLSKSYRQAGQNLSILRNLNLEVKTGESVAILGASGSGKTTLLSLLAGLDTADQGSIEISGTDITQLSAGQITQFRGEKIGIVFQQFHLVDHLTALENVMLPLEIAGEGEARRKAPKFIESMGLKERAGHFPRELSGGECQRVAIARALVREPELLLADEPSGNLDTATGSAVMKIFFDLVKMRKITTVLVTHSEELAKQCDRQLILRDGQL